ncbi:Replication factor A protein 2 [Taxawa tesnikishii (nom. ined.)]|nr:Replication factor A protein 2 [Dothideales sp. JES 119]
MNYGGDYSTTSYGAQGGAGGGGFMPGSQESPSGKKSYNKDTLRPVTIKQLIDAQHPHPDAEYFMIDGAEATQVTFVGQIRNISTQTTNVTYRLDDGTGTFEVKQWIDSDTLADSESNPSKLTENSYARVWGKLKTFGKRHVASHVIRPITDYNEINYHLLEATVVHLYFTRGPADQLGKSGAQEGEYGGQQQSGYGTADGGSGGGDRKLPPTASSGARKDIATRTQMDVADVLKAGDELQALGLIYTTVDDQTWALLDI